MRKARFIGWTLLAFTLSSAVELAAAHACKCVPSVTSRLSDAVDVPLDIAPILRGYIAGPVTWTAEDGSSVAFDERSGNAPAHCPGPHRELRPKSLLSPNTLYTIRARHSSGEGAEIRFTTGTNRTPELIPPKPTLVATLVRRRIYDSCNTQVNGCLALGDTETEVTVLDPQGAELNWFVAQGDLHLEKTGENVGCIEARTRNAAGRRSEPVRLCGAELALHDPFFSDYKDSFLHCVGGRIPSLLDPDAAVPWPSDAHSADAGSVRAEEPATKTPPTTMEVDASSFEESVDGCSLAGGGEGDLLSALLAFLAGVRRRRSPD